MFFGFGAAAVAGFILTAVPNWIGRLPLKGWPLFALTLVWILGRVAVFFSSLCGSLVAAVIDVGFLGLLALAVTREVLAGKNKKNLIVCLLLSLLAITNAIYHWHYLQADETELATHMTIAVFVMLIALIGGRIIPSFTRNWLAKRDAERLPAPFRFFDRVALLTLAVALIVWIVLPDTLIAGVVFIAAGLIHAFRLSRWCSFSTLPEPIVVIVVGAALRVVLPAVLGFGLLAWKIPAVVWGGGFLLFAIAYGPALMGRRP